MIKLFDSNYDEESGISFVEIETDYGHFCGYSFLSDDDKEIASSFLGCELAEYRAIIQYFEKCLMRVDIQIKCIEDLKKRGLVSNIADKRLSQYENYKKELKDNIKSLNDLINNKLENRIKIIEHMNKIKEKKEKGE